MLDKKLTLCIECEKLVKAEKKMSMKEFCRMVENQEGKSSSQVNFVDRKEYREDPQCPQQYKKEEVKGLNKHSEEVPLGALQRCNFVVH